MLPVSPSRRESGLTQHRRRRARPGRRKTRNLTLMTRQAFFNLAALALLALLALNTAGIARSLRRIERKERHPTLFLIKAPTLSMEGAGRHVRSTVAARCHHFAAVDVDARADPSDPKGV